MSPDAAHTPVPRRIVLLLALALAGGIVALVWGTEALRHPAVIEPTALADGGDPREELACPRQPPSEGTLVTSDQLYECPALFDGATIRVRGEAVGALLDRGEGTWAQLNDDAYAGDLGPLPAHRDFRGGNAGIGVHLPRELADRITHVGGPDRRGDLLIVTGVFHRVDAASGEVAVVRATDAHISRDGEEITHAPLVDRRNVGIVVALAAAALLVGEQVVIRRRNR